MYGFHSDKGVEMLKRLPRVEGPKDAKPVSQATRNFREWRKSLVEQGWWEREWDKEAFNIGSWAATLVLGICLAQFHQSLALQFAAVVALGIANTIGGWLSHDYVHARGPFGEFMRPFGYLLGGMSTTWWSDKHNVHHARTNEVSRHPSSAYILLLTFCVVWVIAARVLCLVVSMDPPVFSLASFHYGASW